MSTDVLVLFTKPPRPGKVKTRLVGATAGALTPERAAALHWAMVLDQLDRLSGGDFELRIAWALEADDELPELGIPGFRQEGEDLGARLWHGLDRVRPGARRVAAVGSDHPALGAATVESAFARLEAGTQVVLGPAEDGGYYLFATLADCLDRRLFTGVSWSTGTVLRETLERSRELALNVETLPPERDVDTPADLAALAAGLGEAEGTSAPRTRRLLADWGMLPG